MSSSNLVGNASLLEIAWTLLAILGTLAAGSVAAASARDAGLAFRPPAAAPVSPTERALGLWLCVKWSLIAIANVCTLVIGAWAVLTPAPGAQAAAGRTATALITGAALILLEILLVGVALGQLLVRAWLLRRRDP